ncbi:MAG: glycosyltransferase [Planctomycetaceae bacterium]|nr:glycosyltransferase [Planctomycetaceae bacterium]
MPFEPTEATHIVFSPPRMIGGEVHRGVIATDIPGTVRGQIQRELWAVLLFLHGPTIPTFSPEVDLYLTSATFREQCPHPQVHLTARNFVDEQVFRPISATKTYDLIFNATWLPFKRHELLIDALTFARDQGRPIRCMWFGYHWCTGFEQREADLKQIVADRQLPVDFLPTDHDPEEVNRRFNACRSLLICSTSEAGPRVMGEAMLTDLPCIVTRDTWGGVPELITSACGLLCEPNGSDIAKAIWRALDLSDSWTPREWALENLCVSASLRQLKRSLQQLEQQTGWRINHGEVTFPGFDWQGRQRSARMAENQYLATE